MVLMDSTEVATMLKVPERTLDQWAYRKIGPPFIRVGRHRRYRAESVERWLVERTTETVA